MKSIVLPFLCLLVAVGTGIAAPKGSEDYSKRILGRWLGPKNKFRIFHADGTWGVQRHEDAPEGIAGRRWRIDGKKLFLTYPTDNGVGTPVHMVTSVYTIIFFTPQNFTIRDEDGRKEAYERAP
jgi:hypothetical protein